MSDIECGRRRFFKIAGIRIGTALAEVVAGTIVGGAGEMGVIPKDEADRVGLGLVTASIPTLTGENLPKSLAYGQVMGHSKLIYEKVKEHVEINVK